MLRGKLRGVITEKKKGGISFGPGDTPQVRGGE